MTPKNIRREIQDRLLKAIRDQTSAIYLHGSQVKGTARPGSDWDVAVVLNHEVDDWAEENLRLARLFYPCPFAVDVQVFEKGEFALDAQIPGTLPHSIASAGERLYARSR
jgi:predicted nucleotidyltransferase